MRNVLLWCISLLISFYLALHRCDTEKHVCPEGWMTLSEACYGVFYKKLTWSEAQRDCRNRAVRGNLASILNKDETKKMSSYIRSLKVTGRSPVWIGLFYMGASEAEEKWWWMDGYKTLYRNWANGTHKVWKYDDYCVYLVGKEYEQWNETDCKKRYPYLCKYELKYQRR